MRRGRSTIALLVAVLALSASAVGQELVKLEPVTTGAMPKMGGYMPQRLDLTAEKPSGLVKGPELAAPLYGVLSIGPRESPTRVIVAVDQPEGQPTKLYVDSNANGDLTDDSAPQWTSRTQRGPNGQELV